MSTYLAVWGGAAADKAYKDAGTLELAGPFPAVEEAWEFSRVLDDNLLNDWMAMRGFSVLTGEIAGVQHHDGSATPVWEPGSFLAGEWADRIEEYLGILADGEEPTEVNQTWPLDGDDIAALDRWCPGWRAERAESHGR